MNPEKPNRLQEIAHDYLQKVASDGRTQRLREQRYARLAVDTYLMPRERVCEALGLERDVLDRMLTAGGVTLSADCAQLHHKGCIGTHWSDSDQLPIACQCDCHRAPSFAR